ncbi:MAG: hypothetical protein JXC32_14385 [Anaerolineae bacterium]|nr:hypothetical protein [Anaerolineae bacterium]
MDVFLVRTTLYVVLPLVVAAVISALDPTVRTRAQKLEVTLIYLFGLGVAGSGIGGAIGHLFLSDQVAEAVGWTTGSPFQLEMGFANLALGVLGLIAVGRRDGFREATVTAVTVIGIGATIVHLIDIAQTGNLAPGNTLQNVANLAKPVLLIAFLRAGRRATLMTEAPPPNLNARHGPVVGWLAMAVSTGFALGYALDRLVLFTGLGVLFGAAAVWLLVARSRAEAVDPVAP